MTDTPPEVEDVYAGMLARLTGTERLRMVSDMFETAKALVIANILANEPNISPVELQGRLFSRLYADDLDERTRAAVVAKLKEPALRAGGASSTAVTGSSSRSRA